MLMPTTPTTTQTMTQMQMTMTTTTTHDGQHDCIGSLPNEPKNRFEGFDQIWHYLTHCNEFCIMP